MHTTMYLLNRYPTKAMWNQTPLEAWSGRKPSVNHLKIFGSICYTHIPKEKMYKLDEVSEKCIFVGYSSQSKGYRLYNLQTDKIIVCRDILFDKNISWNWNDEKVEKGIVLVDDEQHNEEEFQPLHQTVRLPHKVQVRVHQPQHQRR